MTKADRLVWRNSHNLRRMRLTNTLTRIGLSAETGSRKARDELLLAHFRG